MTHAELHITTPLAKQYFLCLTVEPVMILTFAFNVTDERAILVIYATSGYVCPHKIKI